MKKLKRKISQKKKNSFNILPILIVLVASILVIFISQQINKRQTLESKAAEVTCNTLGGCGGNCNPSRNNGCGSGGCRYWEYCADENHDNVYSCYDTTNLGKKEPDYSRACGQKAGQTSTGVTNPTATRIPTQKINNPATSAPTQKPAPNVTCNNPQGCGGNCNPATNLGCGYGGCRFWEYCADENHDNVYSCYDSTNNGNKDPDFNKACGYDRTSSTNPSPTNIPVATSTPKLTSIPSPTNKPNVTAAPTATTMPTSTTQPNQETATPLPTQPPTGAGSYDMSKLCIPIEINGSQADKLDIAIIPVGFTKSQLENGFYDMASTAVQSLKRTNLQKYSADTYKKLNWQIINVAHPDFKTPLNIPAGSTEDEALNYAFNFGVAANYCGRDLFMIIPYSPGNNGGVAIYSSGAVVYSGGIAKDGGYAFAHEWGHAAGNLRDEVPSTNNSHGGNCTPDSTTATPLRDPCPPEDPSEAQIAGAYYCNAGEDLSAYQKPCPAWDCNVINCSPLAKELLKGSGCYPRCGTINDYRPAPNSIMSNPWDLNTLGLDFNGPSLVRIIEVALSKYK